MPSSMSCGPGSRRWARATQRLEFLDAARGKSEDLELACVSSPCLGVQKQNIGLFVIRHRHSSSSSSSSSFVIVILIMQLLPTPPHYTVAWWCIAKPPCDGDGPRSHLWAALSRAPGAALRSSGPCRCFDNNPIPGHNDSARDCKICRATFTPTHSSCKSAGLRACSPRAVVKEHKLA